MVRAVLFGIWSLGCAGKAADTGATPPTDTTPAVDPLSWSVEAAGPYAAGYQSWSVGYDPPVGAAPREITVNVWYPTEAKTGEEVAYLGFYLDPEALGGAPAAQPVHAAGYPVLVHSHGDQAFGGSGAFLFRWFASHGWVVLAPDHTHNTIVDNVDPRPTLHYLHRPWDISAALDALAALPADDPLSAAHTDAVLMSGHSFGAYTTWSAGGASYDADALAEYCPSLPEGTCSEDELSAMLAGELDDPRVVAAITMAGAIRRGFHGDQGHLSVHAPYLLMSGSEDGDGMAQSWDGLAGIDRTWIDLEGGCHETFNLGLCTTLDVEEGYRIVDIYALAFGRHHLLGDASETVGAILDGSHEVSSAVSLVSDSAR